MFDCDFDRDDLIAEGYWRRRQQQRYRLDPRDPEYPDEPDEDEEPTDAS